MDYVAHKGTAKSAKKYVEVRRMNNMIWKEPLRLKKGLLALKDYTKIKPPIQLKYTQDDIQWFLRRGLESFMKYNAQVM